MREKYIRILEKHPMLENRRLGAIVLALAIIISVFAIGGAKLRKMRDEAIDAYYYGTDASLSSRHSIDAYLQNCSRYASNLASEASLILGADDTTVVQVNDEAAKLKEAGSISEASASYELLSEAVEELYTAIQAENVDEESMTNIRLSYKDYTGAMNMIKYDVYHSLEREYNDTVDDFPASVISLVNGLNALESFE